MATIDRLDIGIYVQYARRTQMIEELQRKYHLEEIDYIPAQTKLVDIHPRLSELELLLGIVPRQAPWAFFTPPKSFYVMRSPPYSLTRILPSFEKFDKAQSLEEKINSIHCSSPREEQEKAAILGCAKEINKINDWLGFIAGRIGQFLQG